MGHTIGAAFQARHDPTDIEYPVMSFRKENTIGEAVEIRGRGYWSGQSIRLRVEADEPGAGVTFVRDDLPGAPTCPARIECQEEAALRTNIQCGEARFEMIEHIMAALAGMRIDNARVIVDHMEMPGMDGSSSELTDAIAAAGAKPQVRTKETWRVDGEYRLAHRGGWLFVSPSEAGESYYEYQMSFDDSTPIVPQAFGIDLFRGDFRSDVSPARTFVTLQQAEAIRAQGLATHVTNQDLLVLTQDGPVDNAFRFDNECARHKTLDLIGDLALTGVDLIGRIVSFRGGHALNGRMAKRLAILARQSSILYSGDRRVIRSAA